MKHPLPLTDAELETIVADAIAAEAAAARHEAAPPSSAIVWWRAQMRARQEGAKAVDRSLTIVPALALACAAGLLLSIVGTAVAGVKGSLGWLTNLYGSLGSAVAIDLTSRWITLSLTAILLSAVVASIAAVVIFADE